MTLIKKATRTIKINNETFRWVISPNNDYIVLVVENNDIKGSKINVYIETDIDKYWINFPKVENMNLKVIKPKDVEFIIKQAIKQGWDSKKSGKPIIFYLKQNVLIKG